MPSHQEPQGRVLLLRNETEDEPTQSAAGGTSTRKSAAGHPLN